jgi:diguanylate cyclase (GGDEF)-like protein
MNIPFLTSDLIRSDSLTGCKSYLSFIEYLAKLPSADLPHDYSIAEALPHVSWNQNASLLFVEINHMKIVNENHGHTFGDSVIRWLGILLMEESGSTVYRIGGVEFAVLLQSENFGENEETLKRILIRIKKEAKDLGMAVPAVHIVLIHYQKVSPASPAIVLMQMSEAMLIIKKTPQIDHKVFLAEELKVAALAYSRWTPENESDLTYQTRWIAYKNILHALGMAKKIDQLQEAAYTDAISGLPNLTAALLNLDKAIQNSSAHKPFSLLLIDGDNIRVYNSINYAAGDEMIRDMCVVFKNNVRPNDFVARWRTGDEFVVILPDTPMAGAKIIAERIRLAVKETSELWRFPVTVSIGVASYPMHGDNLNTLIDKAEYANKRAKDLGKDQVVLAD